MDKYVALVAAVLMHSFKNGLPREWENSTLSMADNFLDWLTSRPTPDAADLPAACAGGNHYCNDGIRAFDYCPDCGKPLI